jgi:tetratricopeptide (TPR) repeat protein
LLDAALLPETIQAASRMQSLVQGKPEEWKSRDLLGLGYSCQGDGERAIKELLVSTKIEEHKQNLYHLARVYFEGGNLVKARETNIRAFQVEEDAKEWQELAKELMRKIEAAEASAPGTAGQPPQG